MTTPNQRTIVVGYDGSPASQAAVAEAAQRAGAGGAHLVVVHAHEVPADYVGAPWYQHMMDDVLTRARTTMDALERDVPELARVDYEPTLIGEDPATAILQAAEARDAAEVVVGSRGLGRVGSLLLGSVAQRVIHGATCPVVVIPDGYRAATAG